MYNVSAVSYAKALSNLNKRKKSTATPEKKGGLLSRAMSLSPRSKEPESKEPSDIALDIMEEIRKYRNL
tara:strand:+ start:1364 stop:1570 length:207 start_codon:yes stop_codon:yes gene_type:complete